MIPIPPHDELQLLAGSGELEPRPLPPYSAEAGAFLAALAAALRDDPAAGRLADVMAFAFWIRPGNLDRLRGAFGDAERRLGLGLVLHIAPSNVPVNFAFSYAFGLLAGNANIVRVPSRAWPQVTAIYAAMNRVFDSGAHDAVRRRTAIVRYPREDAITGGLSGLVQGRVIWGGDATVAHIRTIPLPPRAREIAFADRWSLCVMDAGAVAALDPPGLARLARGFFNDTYLVDQNACSSPHLVLWRNAPGHAGEQRFWEAVEAVARERYPLEPIKQVDKYTRLLCDAVALDGNAALRSRHHELVYRVELRELVPHAERLRGRFGYFYEHHARDLGTLAEVVTDRYQTLTYFGVDSDELRRLVLDNCLPGIDRITPVGRALDIDVVWDGVDVVRGLSRIVDVR